MSKKDYEDEQGYTEKFENLCHDKHGKKPADLPMRRLSRREKLLLFGTCLLRIIRKKFTDEEKDFLIAYCASEGKRAKTAETLGIEPSTVDDYCDRLIQKIRDISNLLIKLLSMSK